MCRWLMLMAHAKCRYTIKSIVYYSFVLEIGDLFFSRKLSPTLPKRKREIQSKSNFNKKTESNPVANFRIELEIWVGSFFLHIDTVFTLDPIVLSTKLPTTRTRVLMYTTQIQFRFSNIYHTNHSYIFVYFCCYFIVVLGWTVWHML